MIRNYRKLFETEFSLDLDDVAAIEICGYTWSKIGVLYGCELYLCDDRVRGMPFSESGSNDWRNSDIRKWLNTEFYRKIPSEYKDIIVKHDGDNVFLLSKEEYHKFRNNIINIHEGWWLRSPSKYAEYSTFVNEDGVCCNEYHVGSNLLGVRPAMLLQ